MGMDKSGNKKIAIIGVGHMGKCLLNGLVSGGFTRSNILLSNTSDTNREVAKKADWIIIAVRPLLAHKVMEEIKDVIQDKLLISVVAAVPIKSIENYTQNLKQKIIRIMPNIPITYNQGVVGLYSSTSVSVSEKNEAIATLSLLGLVIELKKENELDILTLISACGPAIVSYFMNIFSRVALSFGLSNDIAELLTMQTFIGTLFYLKKTDLSPEYLQKIVTTKGGVTEEIIKSLTESELYPSFEDGIKKGKRKIDKIKAEIQN